MYHLAAKVLKPCSFPQDPSQGVSREGLSFMLLSLEPFFVSPAPCLKFRVISIFRIPSSFKFNQ